MTTPTRVATAAVIGVLAVGGAFFVFGRPGQPAIGGPSPAPTPSPVVSAPPAASPAASAPPAASASAAAIVVPALTQPYTSARYGVTLSYPAGSTTTAATQTWTKDHALVWDDSSMDRIRTADVRLAVASLPLDPGQTPAAWYKASCEVDTPADECAAAIGGGWEKVVVDGATGYRQSNGERPPVTGVVADGVMFAVQVVSGGRGYEFVMDGHVNRAMFDAFLATIRFPVIPTLDKTYTSTLSGYSIAYPSDWTVKPATKPWTSGYATMPYSDQIGLVTSMYVTSMKLPPETSFNTWFAGYDADRLKGTNCGALPLNEVVTVDGVYGNLDVHCPAQYLEAVIPAGGRVYVVTMFQPYSRPLFYSMLSTIRLTPKTAAR